MALDYWALVYFEVSVAVRRGVGGRVALWDPLMFEMWQTKKWQNCRSVFRCPNRWYRVVGLLGWCGPFPLLSPKLAECVRTTEGAMSWAVIFSGL